MIEMGARDATKSIEQLLQSLEQLEQSDLQQEKAEDLVFLRGMLKTPEFHSLLKFHDVVSMSTREDSTQPSSPNALTLTNFICYDTESGSSPEEEELFQLLTSPHVNAIIAAHDRVANKEYPFQSVTTKGKTDRHHRDLEMKAPVRVVCMDKKKDPLGATVRRDDKGQIIVSRVLCGGVAARSGVLHSGDIIHEINGESIKGWSIDQVATLMQALTGIVTFKITPALDEFTLKRRRQESIYIRSLVNYDPKTDRHHPCHEAGLVLRKGAMFQVVEQDDPEWWQAIREGDKQESVGLIPSKKHMEWMRTFLLQNSSKTKRSLDKKKASTPYNIVGKEIVTYEEMSKIDPQPGRPRPIMLIAPRNGPFKLEDLKAKLLSENPSEFDIPIPHTSRKPSSGEVEGRSYHFVRRSQMEKDIMNGRMIEHAYLDGSYYGTSVSSIRNVVNSGKTCLLLLDPQAIKSVRSPELRPFIVYFSTPSADYMKKNWLPKKKIKDTAMLDIVRQATHLEQTYSHYFDHHISFEDLETAYREIVQLACNLQTNQQWVPSHWLN